MKFLFVFGTRPEIIKCYTTYRALKKRKHDCKIYFTSQHTDKNLLVWDDFKYDKKDIVDSPTQADCFIVQGDTWSCLQGTMIARRAGVPLAHIEAGLRSYDDRMIEEKIRTMVDFTADYLFAPTAIAQDNISKEFGRKSFLVGNPIYDLLKNQKKKKDNLYILTTLHRPETVDDSKVFSETLDGISWVGKWFNLLIKFVAHPRTINKMMHYNLYPSRNIELIESMPYNLFIEAMKMARLVITDSGGVQEEASILGVPCLTVRKSTERPETVYAKHNVVCGNDPNSILMGAHETLSNFDSGLNDKIQLYGDGKAGEKIAEVLCKELK